MCFHFIGPYEVAMDKRERQLVLKAIDALRELAEFNFGVSLRIYRLRSQPRDQPIVALTRSSFRSAASQVHLSWSYGAPIR